MCRVKKTKVRSDTCISFVATYLLSKSALIRHVNGGSLELGSELTPKALDELDGFLVGRDAGTRVLVEVCPPGGSTSIHVGFGRLGVCATAAVHLGTESLDFFEREIGRAAHRVDTRGPGRGALGVHFGALDDVGGRVQIALGVAADELSVLGEGDVALDDAGALEGCGLVRFESVLGILHAGAAVADRKVGLFEFLG